MSEPDFEQIIEELKRDVDRTLIIENLRRTPERRLHNLRQMQELVAEARATAARMRRAKR